jgi:hypothetical protein
MKIRINTGAAAGILFLIAMVTYGAGSGIIASVMEGKDHLSHIYEKRFLVVTGALLMLINSIAVIMIGLLAFPVLRPVSRSMALGYLAARMAEAMILTSGLICLLLEITISREYISSTGPGTSYFATLAVLAAKGSYLAYQLAMIFLGLGSTICCAVLYRSRLIPRLLAAWGFTGYLLLFAGALSELFDLGLGILLSVPGGLFEIVLAFWLIFRRFRLPEQNRVR